MSSLSMETNSVLTNNSSNCNSSVSVLFLKPKPDCIDEISSDVCSLTSSTAVYMDDPPLNESYSVVMNKRPRLEDN